jgi:hypothetical protein
MVVSNGVRRRLDLELVLVDSDFILVPEQGGDLL